MVAPVSFQAEVLMCLLLEYIQRSADFWIGEEEATYLFNLYETRSLKFEEKKNC